VKELYSITIHQPVLHELTTFEDSIIIDLHRSRLLSMISDHSSQVMIGNHVTHVVTSTLI